MKYLSELVGDDFEDEHQSHTLRSSRCRAGAASDEHTHAEHNPCDVRPLSGVVAEQSGAGDERDNLEQSESQGVPEVVSVLAHEIVHHDGCACHNSPDIQPYLAVAEEVAYLTLYDGGIEQQEIDAGEETEERCGVFDEGRVEKFCRAVVCGEASCRECCHRIVDAVECRHAADVVAQSADKRENDVYHPDEVCAGREPRVHLRMYRSGCLG